ncbi:MAG: hypothetical protein Q4B43_04090 [Bacteroidota bacterium]|nr:hypothetical protein [Bacteroidota bacterium]
MKKIILFLLFVGSLTLSAQGYTTKYVRNELYNVKGTDYVLSYVETTSKYSKAVDKYLLFINSKNGDIRKISFPFEGIIKEIEQTKIDELGINVIVVDAKTKDIVGRNGINVDDPTQLFIIDSEGKDKKQLTEDEFFVTDWIINYQTGYIVVLGSYDYIKELKIKKEFDKPVILIYDLKTLELVEKKTNY